jgi:hypothetical protein
MTHDDVVPQDFSDLGLYFGLEVDASLYGAKNQFLANFRIQNVWTGQVYNHLWQGQLDIFQSAGTAFLLLKWWSRASDAGVGTGIFNANEAGPGLYLFRPLFHVIGFDGPLPVDPVVTMVECDRAEFAVGEEHYFVLGCTPFLT